MNKRTLRMLMMLVLIAIVGGYQYWQGAGSQSRSSTPSAAQLDSARLPEFLPPEAEDTLARIANDGPFRHEQDGGVFGNHEHRLPEKPRGYYHEYTVETPGADDRGARRIITGGQPPTVYYYTDDHYRSFRQFKLES